MLSRTRMKNGSLEFGVSSELDPAFVDPKYVSTQEPELRSHSGPGAVSGDNSGPGDFVFWSDWYFPVHLISFLAGSVFSGPEKFYMLPVRSGVI